MIAMQEVSNMWELLAEAVHLGVEFFLFDTVERVLVDCF